MPPKPPTISESMAVMIERVDNYQKENRVYFKEINQHLEKLNNRTVKHESRLGTLEGRQSLIAKLTLGAIGGGGLLGGLTYAILDRLGIGNGGG